MPKITTIRLCSTPLTSDYKNQISFANVSAQTAYFVGRQTHIVSNASFLREQFQIRWPAYIDDLLDSNYVMYSNGTKWFYGFITSFEYANDQMTLVNFEIDYYQTYMFQLVTHPCFTEREHVSNDTIGAHVIDEGIDTGDFIVNSRFDVDMGEPWVLIGVTLSDELEDFAGGMYNGVYSAVGYYAFSLFPVNLINAFISIYKTGHIDAIVSVSMIPRNLLPLGQVSGEPVNWETAPVSFASTSIQTTLDGYTPKNNKLLCYPYNLLYVSNLAGNSAIFRYEHFGNPSDIQFWLTGNCTPSCSAALIPTDYENVGINYDEMITLDNYAICSWINDVYANWLAQNSNKIKVGFLGSAVSIATSAATKDVGRTISGFMSVFEQMAAIKDRQIQPPQARGNTNSPGLNQAIDAMHFEVFKKSIKEEYARSIDEYFEVYGYKVNRVKVPNITGRPYWNYVKTIDCNFDGVMPVEAIQRIRQMFNEGVTIWHSGDNVGNYSLNNH